MMYSFIGSILLPSLLLVKDTQGGPYEKLLYQDLMADYSPLVRPVLNESHPVNVKLGLDLQQIIDVEWWDAYLRWDAERYGNVSEVRLPISAIWRPDILLYNSADQAFDSTYHSQAVAYRTYFPFDDQRCRMKYGSWTYSGKQINLINATVERSTYIENGEWLLVDYDVTFTIWLRRRTLYYNLNLVVPCMLISALALLGFTLPPDSGEKISLGVTIFMSLCVTMLMVAESMPQTSDAVPLIAIYFSCIMLVVTEGLILTVVVLNFHHRRPETHDMPDYIKTIFLKWLPWLLRMRRPGEIVDNPFITSSSSHHSHHHQNSSSSCSNASSSMLQKRSQPSKSLLSNVLDIEDENGSLFGTGGRSGGGGGGPFDSMIGGGGMDSVNAPPYPIPPPRIPSGYGLSMDSSNGKTGGGGGGGGGGGMIIRQRPMMSNREGGNPDLFPILKELRYLTDRLRDEDNENEIMNDWKWAAMVADRLSLILCALFLLMATFAFIMATPHLFV